MKITPSSDSGDLVHHQHNCGSGFKDEDIIAVLKRKDEYIIAALVPVVGEPDGESKIPFELVIETTTNLRHDLETYMIRDLPEWLEHGRSETFVLASTLSGTGLTMEFLDRILKPLLNAFGLKDGQYKVSKTQEASYIRDWAESSLLAKANEGTRQTVIMLTGDGGVVETLNGILASGERSRYAQNTHLIEPL